METVVICIGNSDNRLTQVEWSRFVVEVRVKVGTFCRVLFFDGGSANDSQYQNACFVADIASEKKDQLRTSLNDIRYRYRQNSIAVVFGQTELV